MMHGNQGDSFQWFKNILTLHETKDCGCEFWLTSFVRAVRAVPLVRAVVASL